MSAPSQIGNTLELAAEKAMRKAADYLTCLQERDGHWCAELTADTTLESDYILFQLWLYPPVDGKWTPETRPLIDKAVVSILERQLPDGGFNIYAGGPSEVSASVKAYFALKLAGVSVDSERMRLLRERILILDGAMGTMIQQQRLEERDFRGERFARHGRDLRGKFDGFGDMVDERVRVPEVRCPERVHPEQLEMR